MTLTNSELHQIIKLAETQQLPWELEIDPKRDEVKEFAWIWNGSVGSDRGIVCSGLCHTPERLNSYLYLLAVGNSAADMAKEILRLRQELGDLVVE